MDFFGLWEATLDPNECEQVWSRKAVRDLLSPLILPPQAEVFQNERKAFDGAMEKLFGKSSSAHTRLDLMWPPRGQRNPYP
eukprot:461466-Prorocentrum_minimum.AAC.1